MRPSPIQTHSIGGSTSRHKVPLLDQFPVPDQNLKLIQKRHFISTSTVDYACIQMLSVGVYCFAARYLVSPNSRRRRHEAVQKKNGLSYQHQSWSTHCNHRRSTCTDPGSKGQRLRSSGHVARCRRGSAGPYDCLGWLVTQILFCGEMKGILHCVAGQRHLNRTLRLIEVEV